MFVNLTSSCEVRKGISLTFFPQLVTVLETSTFSVNGCWLTDSISLHILQMKEICRSGLEPDTNLNCSRKLEVTNKRDESFSIKMKFMK